MATNSWPAWLPYCAMLRIRIALVSSFLLHVVRSTPLRTHSCSFCCPSVPPPFSNVNSWLFVVICKPSPCFPFTHPPRQPAGKSGAVRHVVSTSKYVSVERSGRTDALSLSPLFFPPSSASCRYQNTIPLPYHNVSFFPTFSTSSAVLRPILFDE